MYFVVVVDLRTLLFVVVVFEVVVVKILTQAVVQVTQMIHLDLKPWILI
jgi:hypothetical protein